MSSRLVCGFLLILLAAFAFPAGTRADPPGTQPAATDAKEIYNVNFIAAVLRDPHSSEEQLLRACDALRDTGPGASSAIPALIDIMDKGVTVRHRALDAVAAIGGEAALDAMGQGGYVREAAKATLKDLQAAKSLGEAGMLKLLEDPKPEARTRGARLLSLSRTATPDAMDALVARLNDSAFDSRHAAADAIKSLRPRMDGAAIDAIVDRLDREVIRIAEADAAAKSSVKVAAGNGAGVDSPVGALERLKGEDAEDRIAALHDLLRLDDKEFIQRVLGHVAKADPDARVRHEAVQMLALRTAQSSEGLTAAMSSADDEVRKAALDILMSIKNSERLRKSMLGLMNHAVEDPNPEIRRSAAIWVARFNPRGPAKPTALLEMLENGTNEERRLAADALAVRHDPADAVAPQWVHALDDGDPQVRSVAIEALGSLGEAAKPAEKKLIKLVADPANPSARPAAFVLLRLVPDGRSAAVAYLAKSLSAGTTEEHEQAVRALATVGAEARPAVPGLVAMLADADNDLRIDAALALGAIGPEAKSSLPSLTRMADNRHIDVRSAAVGALAKIDPEGQSLGPALLAAVLNKDRAACGVLAGPMKKVGTPQDVFRRLEDIALNDPDDGVRETARVTAEELGARRAPPADAAKAKEG